MTHNPYIFIFCFVVMWLVVSGALSLMSGWSALARFYPYRSEDIPQKRHFQSAMVGGVSYNRCLTLGGNHQGLYLSVQFPFNFASPKLFIPWQDIKLENKKWWWLKVLELSTTQAPSVKIMFFTSVKSFIQELYGKPLDAL